MMVLQLENTALKEAQTQVSPNRLHHQIRPPYQMPPNIFTAPSAAVSPAPPTNPLSRVPKTPSLASPPRVAHLPAVMPTRTSARMDVFPPAPVMSRRVRSDHELMVDAAIAWSNALRAKSALTVASMTAPPRAQCSYNCDGAVAILIVQLRPHYADSPLIQVFLLVYGSNEEIIPYPT